MKQQNFIIESENQSQIFMGFTEGYLYHAHLRLELMFVFEGNVNVIVENSQYALKQGDILIVNPFERHAYFATDKNTRAFFIMFPNTFTTQISDMLSNKIFSQTAITNPQLFKETSILIQHIIDHYAVKNYLMLQVDAYISGILTALVAILSKNTVMRPFAEKSGELLFTVLKYLHTNFSEQLNTGTIAAAFGYSERHFAKIFRDFTQRSIPDYLTEIRLNNAIALISDGESIIDASLKSGFNSIATFHRVFKQKYGMSPKAYIKQINGQNLELKLKHDINGNTIE